MTVKVGGRGPFHMARGPATPPTPAVSSYLLLESGDKILLENGTDKVLLES